MSSSQNKKGNEYNANCLSKEFSKPEPVLQQHEKEVNIYYGIFIPNQQDEDEDFKKVYTEKSECLSVFKRYQGARFKGFPTYDEALGFSEYGPVICTPCSSTDTQNAQQTSNNLGEKPSPFRGPKSQELVKFRKAIENGNADYFEECLRSNPRFLVSSGDTPAILQEGSRYNALHIACRNDKPDFCQKILSTISDSSFFQKLYPDDCVSSSERRSEFLLDLYLNTPDKGLNETPLHFACKHGSLECVKILLSYSLCDRTRLNKHSQTPREVICSRLKVPNKDLFGKLNNLFEDQYYVPVLRDEDNCLAPIIGTPWSPHNNENGFSPPLYSSPKASNSPISPMFKIKGYAGPMSPQKADSFYGRWRKSVVPSPSRNTKGKIAALRIADVEKGLERIGRNLAIEFDVEWVEYWNFLENFSNFSSEEGLQKLEEHLKFKYREVIKHRNTEESDNTFAQLENKLTNLDSTQNSPPEDDEGNKFNETRSTLSSLGGLCQELEALRLNTSISPSQDTGINTKKPVTNKRERTTSQTSNSVTNKSTNNINNNCEDSKLSELGSFQDDSYIENEHYNFAIQSTRISSQRLSTILGEVSGNISSHIGPDFRVARKLRNKVKPELGSLRKVLGRCINISSEEKLDFGFVHIFLAAKTIEHLIENVSTSNLFLISETLKLLVLNFNSFDESSSDEEGDNEIVDDFERKELMSHFRCVVQKLEKACLIGIELLKEGKDDMNINLSELEECKCCWNVLPINGTQEKSMRFHPVDTKPINDTLSNSNNERRRRTRNGRLSRAHSFVRRILFGKKDEEEEESSTVIPVFESLIKNKSPKEKHDESVQENEEDTEDSESFASAVSSLDEVNELTTPEQEIKAFINGCEPSKEDLQVYIALEGLSIDENIYPYISQWMRLIDSYSRESRERWRPSCYIEVVSSSSPKSTPVNAKKQLIL